MFRLMDENFQRMEEDLVWLSDKFDYRNKDADWKNSKDALQRGMQKLRSGYPADPVHKAKIKNSLLTIYEPIYFMIIC
mgnify:FL=1